MKLSKNNIKDMEEKLEKARKPLDGDYPAIFVAAEAMTFKKGGFGLKLTYKLLAEDVKGRKVNEYVQLRTKDGKPDEYADDKLIQRFRAFGLSDDEITNVDIPESEKEVGTIDELLGSKVQLRLKAGSYQGKPSTDIKGVRALPKPEAA